MKADQSVRLLCIGLALMIVAQAGCVEPPVIEPSSTKGAVLPGAENLDQAQAYFEPAEEEAAFGAFLLNLTEPLVSCNDADGQELVNQTWRTSPDDAMFALLTGCRPQISEQAENLAKQADADKRAQEVFDPLRQQAMQGEANARSNVAQMAVETVMEHEIKMHLGRQLYFLWSSLALADSSIQGYYQKGNLAVLIQAFDNVLHAIYRSNVIADITWYEGNGQTCQLKLDEGELLELHLSAEARLHELTMNASGPAAESIKERAAGVLRNAGPQRELWAQYDMLDSLLWNAATLHWQAYAWEGSPAIPPEGGAQRALEFFRNQDLDWYESAKLELFVTFEQGFSDWDRNDEWAILAVRLPDLVNPIAAFCEPIAQD